MSNPAFLVDGHMEKLIIQNLCPNRPIRMLGCNGKTVSYEAAAKKAATQIRLLKNNYPIIMVFDKEDRDNCSEEIARELDRAIKAQGIQSVEILIGVPDRMIENWMLADIESVKKYFNMGNDIHQEDYEGSNGKAKIRNLIGSKNKYSETQDGPYIFKMCRKDIMIKNSLSFKCFLETIDKIDCPWAKTNIDIIEENSAVTKECLSKIQV